MMNKFTTRFIALLTLILMTVLLLRPAPVSAQVVSPLQSGHYVPATTNVRDMGQPPPGFFVIWYNLWINTDTYVDRDGNEYSDIFDVSGFATIPALFWASSFEVLGGRYMAGWSPNYVTADGTVNLSATGVGMDTTVSGGASGWSDMFFVPVGLSWGLEQFDITLTYGFYAPTGRYASGADNNVGLGFWTHQFQGYGYYYPFPDKSTALMLGLTYELNSKIDDADLKPGSRFSLEWGVSQYLSEQLEVMVQGGHNWQVSDDSGNDVLVDPGIHDRKSTIMFGLGYWPIKDTLYLAGKYGYDFGNSQRFDNTYWMVNLIWLTGALTGN